MARHDNKWAFAGEHTLPSLAGFFRLMLARPLWALRLLKARMAFFSTRKFGSAIAAPDQYVIESANELVSYWSFFVERECWAREWVEALAQEPHPLVLDVGANAGLFTHWIWTLRPDARFIVFEPLPRMAKKITDWKVKTGANLVLHNQAVSDHSGTAVFYASQDNDPTASLKPEGEKSLELNVPVVTLDSTVPNQPILLMKIDVEGCECEVLAGGRQTVENTRFLVIEAHTQPALNKIQARLGPGWRTRRVGASDYLFMRESR